MAGQHDGDPAAFLSYAHADDKHDGGLITAFRERLEGELQAQVGRDLQIFQDRDDIAWGQAWKERVDDSLDTAAYFIPIVTPRFLASDQCRRELARFLDRERLLGRVDLVLPIYWITVPAIERHGSRAADSLVVDLVARQYADWRTLRFKALSDPECRQSIAELAGRLRDALDPPTHVVDRRPGGDFTTVAAAVAAAQTGERILIRPGVYEGPVVLDKPVELVGEGPTSEIILAAAEGSVLTITGAYGAVRGLTLRATGTALRTPVIDVRAGRMLLDGCDISGSGIGVAVHGHTAPHVRRCRIHDTTGYGVWVYDNGAGVFEDNDITGNTRTNVVVATGGNPTVRRNRITGSQHAGVWVHDNGAGVFEDNDITGNTRANVAVATGGNPTVRRNRITGSQHHGVWVYDNGAGVFEDNTVTDNRMQDWDVTGADKTRLVC